ncbi:hypothetical protein [Sphingobacterium deserti]|nr:hypothetical protein [Sphingobacterium deserti]
MGLLLQPVASFACEEADTHASMSCCDEDQKADKELTKDCCTDYTDDAKGNKDNCANDASCHCPIVKTPMFITSFSAVENHIAILVPAHYPTASTAAPKSGFAATWLLPKIA